ncbi:hypothetical protein [Paenibacillus piri]|uniref:hypothetical protein n=1 Tax=Paenibacillus piri TaxID=2547395 RepID=UPI00140452E0|nr:hypothetical protein [Paenibacillus piri]
MRLSAPVNSSQQAGIAIAILGPARHSMSLLRPLRLFAELSFRQACSLLLI